MEKVTIKRDINFEAMRIAMMALVVVMHYCGHGGLIEIGVANSIPRSVYWLFRAAAYPCVNCFVLLSAYYLSKSHMKWSKILSFEAQVLFFSCVCSMLALMIGETSFSLDFLIKMIFPFSSGTYWYVTSYMLVYMFSPIWNAAIDKLEKKELQIVIGTLIFVFSFLPTFLYWSADKLSMGRDFTWFITLYFLGGYIRKYDLPSNKRKWLVGYIVSTLILWCTFLVISNLDFIYSGISNQSDYFFRMNSIFVLVQTIMSFMFFKELKIKNRRFTNVVSSISPYVFGVYLFHENPVIRPLLWSVINPKKYIGQNNEILKVIVTLVVVLIAFFVIGCILDFIRAKVFTIVGLKKIGNRIDTVLTGSIRED